MTEEAPTSEHVTAARTAEPAGSIGDFAPTAPEAPHAGAPAPPPDAPPAPAGVPPRQPFFTSLRDWVRDFFLGDDPTFGVALVPFCFLSILLFTRHPTKTNFIFDEQEALLANPYVRSVAEAHPKFRWVDAFYKDFWGLGPERSIGSYRPIPNLVWRVLWAAGARDQTPFLHHWVNVLLHGLNGALVCVLAFHLARSRTAAWIAGAFFTASAVLTEAVSGVVGIADVLGATGALLALLALVLRMPWMGAGVFLGTLFGLYSKESALACVPLMPIVALLTAHLLHPNKPRSWARAVVAFAAAAAAFVLYVEARRRMFPTVLPHELSVEANAGKPLANRVFAALLRWYAQPTLPKDPLNNPLVHATPPERIAGALRVYTRGIGQVIFPWTLSGDYSAPQEPIPPRLVFPESVLGALAFVLPFPLAAWLGIRSWLRWRSAPRDVVARDLVTNELGELVVHEKTRPRIDAAFGAAPVIGAGLVWMVLSYFPVSNVPVLLPTVRAERFWYFPVIGTSLVFAVVFAALYRRWQAGPKRTALTVVLVAMLGFQAVAARRHAIDYTDDLSFWDSTRKAVPRSAKAHLNYSVMKGARGDLETRLVSNRTALELAPEWPMASIYLGDTLCRLHRAPEAWPHYVRGFRLAPNDVNLIALAVQCLWDEKILDSQTPGNVRQALLDMRDEHPGSWLQYLVRDILEHGEEHNGVEPKYRPRGYNEGPRDP